MDILTCSLPSKIALGFLICIGFVFILAAKKKAGKICISLLIVMITALIVWLSTPPCPSSMIIKGHDTNVFLSLFPNYLKVSGSDLEKIYEYFERDSIPRVKGIKQYCNSQVTLFLKKPILGNAREISNCYDKHYGEHNTSNDFSVIKIVKKIGNELISELILIGITLIFMNFNYKKYVKKNGKD